MDIYINKFCQTLNIIDLFYLPQETRDLFLKLSTFIIENYNKDIKTKSSFLNYFSNTKQKVFTSYIGLAYIIKNMLNPPVSRKWKFLYGADYCKFLENKKYGIKVLFLEDSHTLEFKCSNSDNSVSANDFIVEQIKTAQCFVDVYLEIPYLNLKEDIGFSIKNTYMRNLHEDLEECFKWAKISCQYPHIRAHYVDLRASNFDSVMNTNFFKFCTIFKHYHYGINVDGVVYSWEKQKDTQDIFQNFQSLSAYMKKLIKHTKIQKQIDNISDISIRNNVIKVIDKWINYPSDSNIKLEYMTWDYMIKALKTKDNLKLESIFFSIWSYIGVLMDAYTIARMFREYQDVPNKYSDSAKNIIVYAGGQHTRRYEDFFMNYFPGTIKQRYTEDLSDFSCVNIQNLQQPLFTRER